jgi:hypothetical protein
MSSWGFPVAGSSGLTRKVFELRTWGRLVPLHVIVNDRDVASFPASSSWPLPGENSIMRTFFRAPSYTPYSGVEYPAPVVSGRLSSPSLCRESVDNDFPVLIVGGTVLGLRPSNSVGLAPVESGRESVSGVSQRNRPRPFCVYAKVKRSCGRMKAEGAFTLRRVVSDRAGHPPTRRVRSKHSHSNTIYGVNSRLGAFFTQVFLSAEGCR